MALVVDASALASFAALPEATVESVISAPTPDLVASFVRALLPRIHEYNALKGDKIRLEVEHESIVRNAESKERGLREKAEASERQNAALQKQLQDEAANRSRVEEELKDAQTSSSTSSVETDALKLQIKKLERSNRDTLGLLTSKTEAQDRLDVALKTQEQKSGELRKVIAALEERNQTTENDLSHLKFQSTQIQGELDSLKRTNEWLERELATRSEEHTKFRKDRNARIAELQRTNEDSRQQVDSLQRTEASLRKKLEELGQRAEEAFSKVQHLQEEGARREEDSRLELDTSRRLADLQQQSANTARRRVLELEQLLETTKDDAAEEISQTQAELETERQGRDAAEHRVEELQSEIHRLESEAENRSVQDGAVTPRHANDNHLLGTPGRAGSPSSFTPGLRARTGLTFTKLLSEFNQVKQELNDEKRSHQALRQTFDELLAELQDKEPEMQQTQEERDHFETQANQLSSLLEEARQEQENARKEARRLQAHAHSSERKSKALEQQLRDLSVQIKVLLVEVQIREQGGQLDAAQVDLLRRAARGEEDVQALEGMSDTARFISQNLIAFKDIFELQENNVNLTKIVRELGNLREEEEAKQRSGVHDENIAELENLRERIEKYKDEMKSLVTQSQSYIRERDMFRRMLVHRGQLPADADLESMFGQSINGGPPATPSKPVGEDSQAARDLADHVKLLKEMQAHFDAYRHESSVEYKTAKDQVERLSKEKSQSQSEFIRLTSQLSLAQERFQMLQSNYDLLKNEHSELQKRTNALHEAAAKQDIRTQQVAEDLVEAKSLADGLRNENANLKAEKDLWKRIESRMTDDNRNLLDEKTRLNKLLTDSHNLANEKELADSEARRKLQTLSEGIEGEVKALRLKLDEELESSKTASLRREYEQEQSRARIDDLVKGLGSAKEELAALRVTRDQLTTRLEEVKIELRAAESRAQALQPRLSVRGGDNESLSHDQELQVDLADLRRELELAKADAENSRNQVEQYRAISQSAEEELSSINDAHDQFKEDAEKLIAEKDAKVQELQQRLEDVSSELATHTQELANLQSVAADHEARMSQQRSVYEGELASVKDECERYKETSAFHQADLKTQADVAQQAQQSYELELIKHAAAAAALTKLREEVGHVRLEVSQARADADAARMALAQNEDSWTATREQYEHELDEIKTRRQDAEAQNQILHTQLESMSSQIASLQKKRTSVGGDDTVDFSETSNFQEVIKFLRREKEIVDVQYELSSQELRRVKQQLDYTTSQLEETRSRLDQERQRRSDNDLTVTSHAKLMETLNELNVLRESNSTLRLEGRQARTQLEEAIKQVETLTGQLQPLRSSIGELENLCETLQGEKKLLEDDRARLQQRIENILQKYNRIDPAELEGLKEQLATLQKERDDAQEQIATLQSQIDAFPAEKQEAQAAAKKEIRELLGIQFKARSKELTGQISGLKSELQAAKSELETVTKELEDTKQTRATTTDETARASNDDEEGQIEEGGDLGSDANLATQLANAQAQIEELQQQVGNLEAVVKEKDDQIAELEAQINAAQNSGESGDTGSDDHLQKLKADLEAAQAELEALRAGQRTSTGEGPSTEAPDVEARISELRTQLEQAHTTRMQELETKTNERVANMRTQLNDKLREGRKANQEELAKLQKQLEEARASSIPTSDATPTTAGSAGGENSFNQDGTVNVKADTAATPDSWTEVQVRQFLATNAAALAIVKKNVKSHVERETGKLKEQHEKELTEKLAEAKKEEKPTEAADAQKEDEIRAKLEEEFQVKLEEARVKAEKTKESAVLMEGKKYGVKISIAETKARNLGAKIEVVEKAAQDTPERAVSEVWAIAKDVKAPPLAPQAAPQTTPAPAAPAAQSAPQAAASNAAPAANGANATPATQDRKTSTAKPAIRPPSRTAGQADGKPDGTAQNSTNTDAKAVEQKLPVKPAPNAGTGPAALRNIANQAAGSASGASAIPRPGAGRGAATNTANNAQDATAATRGGRPRAGSNLPRGAGQAGRGGRQSSGNQANAGATAGGGTTGAGRGRGLDATARQFQPGNKRPREDGGNDGGNKRPRGGQNA